MRVPRALVTLSLVSSLTALPPVLAHVPTAQAGGARDEAIASNVCRGWEIPRLPAEVIRSIVKRVIEFLEEALDHLIPGDPLPVPLPPGPRGTG